MQLNEDQDEVLRLIDDENFISACCHDHRDRQRHFNLRFSNVLQSLLECSRVVRDVLAVDQSDSDEFVHEILQNLEVFKTECFLQNSSCFLDIELVLDEVLVIVLKTTSQKCHDF